MGPGAIPPWPNEGFQGQRNPHPYSIHPFSPCLCGSFQTPTLEEPCLRRKWLATSWAPAARPRAFLTATDFSEEGGGVSLVQVPNFFPASGPPAHAGLTAPRKKEFPFLLTQQATFLSRRSLEPSIRPQSPAGGKEVILVGHSLGSGGCLVVWRPDAHRASSRGRGSLSPSSDCQLRTVANKLK